ncbi:MAG: cation diffusion facilitator family transporter [Bacillota bacterium]
MAHQTSKSESNILSAFFINLFFTIIELFGGLYTNSMAILSDAVHDLGDTISLGLSAFFERFSKKKADKVYTFGYDRFSLLGAVISSFVLFGASIFVLTQAVPRLLAPETVDAKGMIAFASLGVLFNGIAVLKVVRGRSLHEKVITWHLLEDFLGWIAVLVTSVILLFVDWYFLDPLLSILITLYIVVHVLRNLRRVFNVLLQKAPQDIDLEGAIEKIEALEGVYEIHHIHLWSLEGETPMLSMHLVVDKAMSAEEIKACKHSVRTILSNRNVQHVTIETEYQDEACVNPPCDE